MVIVLYCIHIVRHCPKWLLFFITIRPEDTVQFTLKGFDGNFILRVLYQQCREVTTQLTIGAKVLSFQSGSITFKDSLCFLPMPLASFSKTFGFTKKGAISEHENYMTIYERIKREKWKQLPNKRVTNTRITIETISDQKLHYNRNVRKLENVETI